MRKLSKDSEKNKKESKDAKLKSGLIGPYRLMSYEPRMNEQTLCFQGFGRGNPSRDFLFRSD
jgi:hypothetical protein